ncbi:hypothetical protein KW785_00705 [Candidatus Parcubacteria bacterium]|nr:hypothetical protein [Candidatus Parcubacteria bacterium]
MQQIGQGYYYTVYDLLNGRVLKRVTGHRHRLKKLLAWYGKTRSARLRIIAFYPRQILKDRRSLRLSAKTYEINPEIFGNPKFLNQLEYEQDKAITLEDYFESHTFEENKLAFNDYPNLVKILWVHGLSDTVFNFTRNTGISLQTNKLLYIDFNEFSQKKDKVRRCIETKKWRTQKSLRDMQEGELKDYIIKRIEAELTLEKLEELWPK